MRIECENCGTANDTTATGVCLTCGGDLFDSVQSTGSILPSAQERKVKRLIEDGCGLGSVLLHKVENGRGITAIVSPHGHVEWAK